jgi:peptide/nickel transport system substrate-binding protein
VNRFAPPAFAAALALTLAAPGASQSARHAYTMPHVLRYATAEDINGLNPHLSSQLTLSYMSSLTMAWLVKSGAHNEPVPELATAVPTKANGGISADGHTITYHLRRGVKWSDGAPFDADDVVFSIKTIQNSANNEVNRDGWDLIDRIGEPDKYTVVLHLKKPYSTYAYTFFSSMGANPCVLPKHILGSLPTINDAPYNALPVGIGPFRYVAWHRGDAVEMEANPNYFRGLPKLQRITFKIIPDRNTVLTQLEAHEIDLWMPVSANYFDRVKAIAGDEVLREPSFIYDHLDFNLAHPLLADPAVRQALRYAIDRETIRLKVRHGLGALSENIFGPTHPDYHPIPLIPFDIAKAKALLDRAGWKPGPDGVRTKDGMRLNLVVAIPSGTPDTDAIVELIRSTWLEAGASLDVRHYPSNLYFALQADHGIINSGLYDVALYAWTLDGSGDVSGIFGCTSFPPAAQNATHFCDPVAERAMNAYKLEYDPAKQRPYDYVVTDRIAQLAPTVVMGIRDEVFAYNSDLKNFHPNAVAAFDDMMAVDI